MPYRSALFAVITVVFLQPAVWCKNACGAAVISLRGRVPTSLLIAGAILFVNPINCISAVDIKYDSYSISYDALNGGKAAEVFGVDDLRGEAAQYVRGDVLEIALGTALQSKFYDPKVLKSFTGVDLSTGMLKEAETRLAATLPSVKTTLQQMDAQRLLFDDDSFDSVVDTFSMCVIPQPSLAINEMVRVTRVGGQVVLLENARSANSVLGIFQDITEPVVTKFSKECRWNVDIDKLAKENLNIRRVASKLVSGGTIQLNVYEKL
jgi:methyltransferase OMS1, mitochondrial